MKKKKLPNEFGVLVASHDMKAFAEFFEKYEITATNAGKTTANAFSYRDLNAEQARFLIDNGLDPNTDCGYGYTAVAHQASNKEVLECLVENGADVDLALSTISGNALARACQNLNVDAVFNLLNAGASVDILCGFEKNTPLDCALRCCDNAFIPNAYEICSVLLQAGVKPTEKTGALVENIGKRFEFFRDSFNPDYLADTDEALSALYELFGVTPVARRVMNDTEEIKVTSRKWQTQYEELRSKLVPGSGKARTLQGEMIRIVGKVTYEILDNGAVNWDDDYSRMMTAFVSYLDRNEKLEPSLVSEAVALASHVNADSGKADLYRLTELTVNWVIANSKPIMLGDVDYYR